MLNLTSFTCNRWKGASAVPTQVFDKVFALYGKKWNIIKLGEFSRQPVQGEQDTYDKLIEPGFVEGRDVIASNWMLNGLTQAQIDKNNAGMARDRKVFGQHWKQVQFWQGNCSAAGVILGKMTEGMD